MVRFRFRGERGSEKRKKKMHKGKVHLSAWTYLLAAIAGQVERQDREKRYSHAGDDDVDRVKESLPSHRDVERDVQVGLVAAGVKLFVPAKREAAVNCRIDRRTAGRVATMRVKLTEKKEGRRDWPRGGKDSGIQDGEAFVFDNKYVLSK